MVLAWFLLLLQSEEASVSAAHPNRPRRGNITVLAVVLIALLGFAALVVDVGFLYAAQTEIQVATDSAALAGVGYLDLTDDGVDKAREKAVEFANRHFIFGAPMDLPDDAITTGYLDENGAFVASDVASEISAISIDHTKVDIPVWFAGVAFGRSFMAANARSIAARSPKRSAASVDCFLPLAIPDCVLDDQASFQNLVLRLSSAGTDNVGWADLSGHPTPGSINSALLDVCDQGRAEIGDDVYLNNGTIASSLQKLASVLNGATSAETVAWDVARLGPIPAQMANSSVQPAQFGKNILEGPIVLFESPPGVCLSKTQFNQSKPLTGFAWASIYDVATTGGDKNIRVRLDLVNEYDAGTSGGGPDTNVLAPGIGVLVQ
jgi:hypothetical protein